MAYSGRCRRPRRRPTAGDDSSPVVGLSFEPPPPFASNRATRRRGMSSSPRDSTSATLLAVVFAAVVASVAGAAPSSLSSTEAFFVPKPSVPGGRVDGGRKAPSTRGDASSFGRRHALFPTSLLRRERARWGRSTSLSSSSSKEEENADDGVDDVGAAALYVHVPYCRRRCRYCDFAIVPVGGAVGSIDDNDEAEHQHRRRASSGFRSMDEVYRVAVLDELELIARTTTSKTNIPVRSIYFGGGTPSLAPISTLRSILDAAIRSPGRPFRPTTPRRNDGFGFGSDSDSDGTTTEITIEMDPGTFDLPKLESLRDSGFNRISLGVQSFDDAILSSLGRTHRRNDVFDSVSMIRRAFGPDANYSIDLMSGLPGQSLANWAETLRIATEELDPRPSHLSLYDLQVEKGTTFGRWYGDNDDDEDATSMLSAAVVVAKEGKPPPPLPTSEDCAFMYRYASGYLRAKGYEHYEISSYAYVGNDDDTDSEASGGEEAKGSASKLRPRNGGDRRKPSRRRSRHNQIYWEIGTDWYAVGLGATSSIGGHRFARPRQMSDYVRWVSSQREALLLPPPQQQGRFKMDEGLGEMRSSPPLPRATPDWLPRQRGTSTDPDDQNDDDECLADVIMTRLRTAEGLDLDRIEWSDERRSSERVEAILRGAALALDLGMAEIVGAAEEGEGRGSQRRRRRGTLRLVDPDGFLFSNTIISSVFAELGEVG